MQTTTLGRFGLAARGRLTRRLARPLAALGLLLATAGAAHAQTFTFAYTGPGTSQTYMVPAGVTRLQVVATGASGGEGYQAGVSGKGAQVQATITVVPGEVLTVVVGGRGVNNGSSGTSPGGYNGGGAGGYYVGSGGGATDLRRAYNAASASTRTDDYLQSRNALVVAAAGGGAGSNTVSGSGGSGGTPTGSNASGSDGGGGATQTGVGSGSVNGTPATNNIGGDGAPGSSGTVGSGGGGGGYYGGGGGNANRGGGGGSSWATAGASNVSYSVATAAGNGALTITPLVATAPTVTTGTPTNITSTSAQVGVTLTSTGGATTEFGVVYVAGMGTPTTSDTKVVAATVAGSATNASVPASLTNLTPGTTYTVRAYATNSVGTSYGSPVTFATVQAVTAAPVVTAPANNSTTSALVVASFTAPANSSLTVYLNGQTGGIYGVDSKGNLSILYSGLAQGTYTLSATAQSSGQAMSAQSNVVTFTVDATPPTATISTTASSPTSTAPIPFAVSFSEPVTGLSASSFTVFNGTVTSGPTSSGPNAYAFSVTPTGNGTVTVSLAANAVRDAVGNGNTASNSVSVQYTAPVASGLSVQYQTGDLGQPNDGQVRPFLQLVNSGTTAVPYSQLTVRYWLTVENFMGQLVTPIDYAKLGTSFVSARYVALATPRQGAFGYIEYSFAAGAGSLAPGTDSGPIYGKAYKPDYSNFDETDDWSYQTSSSFTANGHVTVYQNGTLVNGNEPPAVATTTALQVYTASRDASASTSYISVQLQVRNTGNVPVNYSDVKARYYFTRDGAANVVPMVDYAKLGSSNVSLRVVNLAAPVNGADAYLEITFSSALGVFYPRTGTDDILFKLRKDDYTAFDQTNDYSFSSATALALNNRFPAYANNQLVFGTPPSGAPARMAATSPAASAGGATIVAAASGPLALTGSPNPFGEQLTLRFALPTTQAYTLAVYDGQGRLVQQVASGEAAADQAQEVVVPTQPYAAGLYLVRLTTASGVQTLKLIKQ